MLGWTKGQELWGKGRKPRRERGCCKAQLIGKSEVRNSCWGTELRLGLGERSVRQGRVNLGRRQRAVCVGDPGWTWAAAGSSPHCPSPWLSVGPGWGLRTTGERNQLHPGSVASQSACLFACKSELGKLGLSSPRLLTGSALQPYCTGAIPRWATAATQLSFQNLSSIFLSFLFPFPSLPTVVWRKESTMYS